MPTTTDETTTTAPKPPTKPPSEPTHTIHRAPLNPVIHHPIITASLLIAATSVMHGIGVPAAVLWVAAVTVPAIVALAWIAAHQHDGPETPPHSETGAIAAGSGVALAWLADTVDDGPWTITAIASLILIMAIAWPAYAGLHRRRSNRLSRPPVERHTDGKKATADAGEPRNEWEQRLAAAGAKNVDVINATQTENGTWMLRVAMKPGHTVHEIATAIPKLESIMSRDVVPDGLRPGAIDLRPDPTAAHAASILIPTRDVMGETIHLAAALDQAPLAAGRTFATPIRMGCETDGTEHEMTTGRAHMLISAMTNSGKTATMDNILIQRTTTTDTVPMVLAGQKGERWLASWLAPWIRGEADRPPFGWVATELPEALMMYASLYEAALWRSRQVSPDDGHDGWRITPQRPAVMVVCDESTDFLTASDRIEVTDRNGQSEKRFSDLDLLLLRIGRSEANQMIKATQRSTATMLGGTSGDSKSQIGGRIALRSPSSHDRTAVLSGNLVGVDLATLPPGAGYVQDPSSDAITLVKFYLPSTEDIQGAAIEAARIQATLDTGTADAMPYWHGRWARQTDLITQMCRGTLGTPTIPSHVRALLDADADAAERLTGTAETPQTTTPPAPEPAPTAPDDLREHMRSQLQQRIAQAREDVGDDTMTPEPDDLTADEFDAMMRSGGHPDETVFAVAGAILAVVDRDTEWTEVTPLCEAVVERLGWAVGSESRRRVRAIIAAMRIRISRRRVGTGDNKREQALTWEIVSTCSGYCA